ncbi:MAG: CpaF family protein [Chloroflexota bacterium]|nr:CpaF family protein [Chloroflexota bacterium]MDE3194408.1 CpaF family protein [Chloroflexota bacterium]
MIDRTLVTRLRREIAAAVPGEELLRSYADPRQRRLLLERVRTVAGEALDDPAADALCADLFGSGPIQRYLDDDEVTDILVNDADHVFVERRGRVERTDARFRDEQELADLVYRIAASVGRELTIERPFVDARMRDGSRANAVVAPVGGPTLSIRKFRRVSIPLRAPSPSWVADGGLPDACAELLERCVAARADVLVSGATGSGKSTLLRSLAAAVPAEERLIVIEDTSELVLPHPHVVHLECVPGREGASVGVADLVENALRMRPDRIIVGEVRTPREASALLEALSTGHEGALTSLHAGSAADALVRLELLLSRAGELAPASVRRYVLAAFDVVVHLWRERSGRRVVREIAAVDGDAVAIVWRSGMSRPAELPARLRALLE